MSARNIVVVVPACLVVVWLAYSPASAIELAQSPGAGSWRAPAAPPDYEVLHDPPAPPGVRRVAPPLPPGMLRRGQYQSIQVNVDQFGNNIVGDAANEPSIAVDPARPFRMAIGWRQFDSISSDFREAGWAHSHDAGRHWTFPGALEEGIFRSDPVLGAASDGNFYYYSLTQDFSCQLFKSLDGGVSWWHPPTPAFGGDKGWMEVDRTGGVGDGNIYCFSRVGTSTTIGFTRSLNGGQTFEPLVNVPKNPGRGTLAIGPAGEVYAAGKSWDGPDFVVARSSNAYQAGTTPVFEFVTSVSLGGSFVAYSGPNPSGLLGQVWVACDLSDGPSRGNLYVLCSVDPPGTDPLDVMLARSTNGGVSWGAPIRINDDPPGPNAWQWFGTMSVAPNGRIDVTWNDTRQSSSAHVSEVYYSYSSDGGVTWTPNEPLTPTWDSWLGWPQQQKIGDYYHMVSDNVGADLAYAATFNKEEDIYFVRIGEYDCNGNGIGDAQDIASGFSSDLNGNGIPDECEGLGDLNCDGVTNAFDIDPFVLALTDPAGYETAYPKCDIEHADINGDGALDAFDIDPFVQLLTGG